MQFQRLDISDPASVDEFGKWAKAELRTVSVLVNTAGESFIFGDALAHQESPADCLTLTSEVYQPGRWLGKRDASMQS